MLELIGVEGEWDVGAIGVEGKQGVGTNWCRRRIGCWNQLVVEGEQGVGTNWCRRGKKVL